MTLPELTAHAIFRARIRWLEPTDGDAARAIRRVLEKGEQRQEKGLTIYQHGTRCARVRDGVVVTVTVIHMKRLEFLRHMARRDYRERKHIQ